MLEKIKHYRMKDVLKFTGFSRQAIYNKMSKGEFPRPFKLGKNTNAWTEDDLMEWYESVLNTRVN